MEQISNIRPHLELEKDYEFYCPELNQGINAQITSTPLERLYKKDDGYYYEAFFGRTSDTYKPCLITIERLSGIYYNGIHFGKEMQELISLAKTGSL